VLNGQARRQVGYGGDVVLRHPNGDTRTIRVAPLPSDQRFKVRRDGTIAELRRNNARTTGEVKQFAQQARFAYAEKQHRSQVEGMMYRVNADRGAREAFKGPIISGTLSAKDHELVRNAVGSVASPFGGTWSEQPFSGDSPELRRIWETGDTFLLAQTLKQHDTYELFEKHGFGDSMSEIQREFETTAYDTDVEWWESSAGREALSDALATDDVPLAVQENLRADVSRILLFNETNGNGGFSGEMMNFAAGLVRDEAMFAELDGGVTEIPDRIRAAVTMARSSYFIDGVFATKAAREELEALAIVGCDRLVGVLNAHAGETPSKVLAELYVTMNEPYLTGEARTAAVEALDTKYSLVERREAHHQLEMYRGRLQQMREGIESGEKYVILTAAALGCVSSPAPLSLSKTGKLVRERALRIAMIRETRAVSVMESGVVSHALSASSPPQRDPELHRLLSQGYKVVSSENGVRQNEPASSRDQAQKSSQQHQPQSSQQQQQQGTQQQSSGPQGGQRPGGQQGSDQQSGQQSGGQQSGGQQDSGQQSSQQSGGQQDSGQQSSQQSGGQQDSGQQSSQQSGGQQSGGQQSSGQQSGEQQDWSDDESSSSQGSDRAQGGNDQQQRGEPSQAETGAQQQASPQEQPQSSEQSSRSGSTGSGSGESGSGASQTAGERTEGDTAASQEKASQRAAPDSAARSEKSAQEAATSKQGADAQNPTPKEQGSTPSEKSAQQAEAASTSEKATASTEQGSEGAKPSPSDAATDPSESKKGDAVDGAQKDAAETQQSETQRSERQAGEQRESRTAKQGGEKTERVAPQTAQRRSTDEGTAQRPASTSRTESESRSAAPSGEATSRPEELTSLDDGQSQKRTRGERGGRKHRTAEERQADRQAEQAREARQSSGASTVGSTGQGQGTRRDARGERSTDTSRTSYAAQKAAKLLSEIESTKTNRTKTRSGTEVDKEELIEALSTGTDPRPALNSPRERGRLSVVLSPDNSPSTAAWSQTANDFAQVLSSMPNTDATVIQNSNGEWDIERGDAGNHTAMSQRMQDADVMLYMGDKDGEESVKQLAADGHTVIALNGNTTSSSAGDTEPYVEYVERTPRGGAVYWVSGVPVDNPDKWTAAMGKVLQMLRS
jgi:hypothetical protein